MCAGQGGGTKYFDPVVRGWQGIGDDLTLMLDKLGAHHDFDVGIKSVSFGCSVGVANLQTLNNNRECAVLFNCSPLVYVCLLAVYTQAGVHV
jgi:hypothetical protein